MQMWPLLLNFIEEQDIHKKKLSRVLPREHEGTERDTKGVGQHILMPFKVIFTFRKSVFRDVRTYYNFDLRFFSEKANFSVGFVVRTDKHFSWGHKRSLYFVGMLEVSARRVHKELINHNLYLFA